MCFDWIKRNVKVYGKNLDLKAAQQIPGLRAVFGESYPDPVRVVTLEYDVDEISKDLQNPKWRQTSVEFCGGTSVLILYLSLLCLAADCERSHVAETGLIKGLVITEESGIAKGIRRIVAVTGHDAYEVTRTAKAMEVRVAQADQLVGSEKDAALKALTIVSGHCNPPT